MADYARAGIDYAISLRLHDAAGETGGPVEPSSLAHEQLVGGGKHELRMVVYDFETLCRLSRNESDGQAEAPLQGAAGQDCERNTESGLRNEGHV